MKKSYLVANSQLVWCTNSTLNLKKSYSNYRPDKIINLR